MMVDQTVSITVESNKDLNYSYSAEVKKSGTEYEFHVIKNDTRSIYQLPPNKLGLLYSLEEGLKDIKVQNSLAQHYKVVIRASSSKKIYKINTDLIANFIGGLKKK